MTPEGEIKLKIKAVLDELGAYYFMPVQMGYGKRTLDVIGCYYSLFFAVEAKRPGFEMTKFQNAIATEMRATGARVFLVNDNASLADMRAKLLEMAAGYEA